MTGNIDIAARARRQDSRFFKVISPRNTAISITKKLFMTKSAGPNFYSFGRPARLRLCRKLTRGDNEKTQKTCFAMMKT
jgi:hypothetical protein